jgi:NAD(P)-dependent dehydrogenase (short-subunit alcohol dehydrogenase family)
MALTNTYPSLRDRAVFITGGGSGIGATLVSAFAAQGARVAFIDLAEEASRTLAASIAAAGHPAPWWQVADVRDVTALQAAVAAAGADLGDFAVLVNNVGHDERHTLESVTPAYFEDRVAINVRAAFFTLQAVLPGMQRRRAGSVINLGSNGWQAKGGDYPIYAIAKSAVNGLTRGNARKLGRDGIRINTVTPGWVMTERQKTLWLDAAGEAEIDRNQCLRERLQAEDIAAMVLFLASDDARLCTAQEYVVDAGWL